MDIVIEPFSALPCELRVFKINGIDADQNDFGYSEDTDRAHAEDYGCGCHQFLPHDEHMRDAMIRYHITEEEFKKIQDKLEGVLYSEAAVCVSD